MLALFLKLYPYKLVLKLKGFIFLLFLYTLINFGLTSDWNYFFSVLKDGMY